MTSFPSVTWCQRLHRSWDFMKYDVGGVLYRKFAQLSDSVLKISLLAVIPLRAPASFSPYFSTFLFRCG